MSFRDVAGGLEGLLLMPPRDHLLAEAVLLALLYQKAVDMDHTFGQNQRAKPRPIPSAPAPRREFDPEHAPDHFDSHGNLLARWRRPGIHGDQGQGLAEYALILALIAIVAVIGLLFIGGQISSALSHIGDSI